MPRTPLVFFKEADGSVPLKLWFETQVGRRDRRALAKIRSRLRMLRRDGWDLRRPTSDTLVQGIHELRVGFGHVNYRLLYFFAPGPVAVVSHGITEAGEVPHAEIELAIKRRRLFESDPERYAYYEEEEEDH